MPQPQESAPASRGPANPAHTTPGSRTNTELTDRVRSLSLARLPERRSDWLPNLMKLALLLLGAGGLWVGYSRYAAVTPVPSASDAQAVAERQPTDRAPGQKAAQPVATAGARPQPAAVAAKSEIALEAKGYIIPAHQILVSPQVSGKILELNVEEGRRVNKGDVLAVLESTEYAADMERAKAIARLARVRLRELENGSRPEEIQQAQAELRETEAVVPQLEAEYKRTSDLRRRSSATQQEFEQSESKYLAQLQRAERLRFALKLLQLGPREERIDAARAEVAQADAEVTKTEWRLGNCTIRAPISGTILKKNAEEGNIVNPIAFNGSYSLCDMADLSDLEVDLNVQERDISVVKVGQKCRVRAEAYPDRVYEGHVDRLMPIADRAKGAIPVRVKISVPAEEEGVYLKPEMGAIVTFLNSPLAPAAVATQNDAAAPLEATP